MIIKKNISIKLFVVLIGILFLTSCSGKKDNVESQVSLKNLLCDYSNSPIGIENTKPRLSWQIVSKERGEKQTAYQIIVSSSLEKLEQGKGDIWNSGKVISDKSAQVAYAGSRLKLRQICYWKVRVWDKDGKMSAYSEPSKWEMGFFITRK